MIAKNAREVRRVEKNAREVRRVEKNAEGVGACARGGSEWAQPRSGCGGGGGDGGRLGEG